MTHLRKIMLEELQRRHYSEGTTRYYLRNVEAFARYFRCPPNRLGPQHIREYQAYLFTKRKLSPGSVTNHLCGLRFFYIQTLKKPWSIADTPFLKKAHRLPTILSQEEVAQLIDAASTPFHHTILMTLYATGIRNAELTRLKVSDIDSLAHGGSCPRRQGLQRSRCDAQPRSARRTPCALASLGQKIQHLAVSR